jgi:hypothetical protein
MTEETIEETEAELTPDRLDDYLVAAASVVEELRDFLSAHHAELIAAKHTPNKWGRLVRNAGGLSRPDVCGSDS